MTTTPSGVPEAVASTSAASAGNEIGVMRDGRSGVEVAKEVTGAVTVRGRVAGLLRVAAQLPTLGGHRQPRSRRLPAR
ncbi:MAG: hypothetical protein ACT4NY_11430 [Pseudonocardiales bacterium]